MPEDNIEQRLERFAKAVDEFTDDSFDELVSKTESESVDVRSIAVSRLGNLEDPRAVPVLLKLIDDSSPRVRAMAALWIGSYKADEARDLLIDRLRNDENGDVRAMCVSSLSEIGGADEEIIKALDDPDWHVKTTAATVLGRDGKLSAVGDISQLLDDSNWNVRYSASVALLDIGVSSIKVVETLSGLRDIPEACEQLELFAECDVYFAAVKKYADEVDQLDEYAPAEEILDTLRKKHGEEAVPYPAKDPLGDLIAQANELIK